MTTEILSIIVVIGAIIVFIANRQMKHLQRDQEIINTPQAVDNDASRIRQELEQTTDEIIQRMATRVDRLEVLIREADKKANILQRRLEKAEKLERRLHQREIQQNGQQFSNNSSNTAEAVPVQPIIEENSDFDPTFSYLLKESMEKADAEEEATAKEVAAASIAAGEEDPDTYSIELSPDEVEAYIKSRSVDAIEDTPVKSLVDEEPEEYRPSKNSLKDNHPQEQAAYLMQQMNRR